MKNAANTSIVLWGGRLLALFEAAQPIAMDPNTLQTLGPDLLGGTVKPGASFHFGKVANRLSGEPPGCLSLQQGCFLSFLVCFGAYSKPMTVLRLVTNLRTCLLETQLQRGQLVLTLEFSIWSACQGSPV